jgi:hypothetical protein
MQREVDKAASVLDRAEGHIDVSRRRLLGGMMALAATATSPAMATAACRCPYDAAMFYLYRRFEAAAKGYTGGTGEEELICHKQILAYANAMVVVPARHDRAIESKRIAAGWSFVNGSSTTRLPSLLINELLASADQDAQKQRR